MRGLSTPTGKAGRGENQLRNRTDEEVLHLRRLREAPYSGKLDASELLNGRWARRKGGSWAAAVTCAAGAGGETKLAVIGHCEYLAGYMATACQALALVVREQFNELC